VVKPVAGQWWQYSTDRRYVVGCTTDGKVVLQKPDGKTHLACPEYMQKTWKHLPDCTCWDWEPETFPQYYISRNPANAYVVRTDDKTMFVVSRDGSNGEPCPWYVSDNSRTRLTEQQALALLDPKPAPAQPRRTVTVPKWLVIDDQGLTFIVEQSEMPDGHNEVHHVGETTYEIE